MNSIQYLTGYLVIFFCVLNGIYAIANRKYLGKNGTYNRAKRKYPNTTQRQWAIFDGCFYILFGVMFSRSGLFALIIIIPIYYIGRELLGKFIFSKHKNP